MKHVLIISPYFPPTNAADMQRVRMSLPYFKEFGWNAEVVTIDEKYSDMVKDELLLLSLPADLKIHKVAALPKRLTSKLGLGSIALRSIPFYRKKVNELLRKQHFDLIYFSTTQFPVCILGSYWKRKFGVPYVIDMQDPWHSEYYQNKPKDQQPHKYWFSYRMNKYLEPVAIKKADGLISVSSEYISALKTRYPEIAKVPSAVITFGAFKPDLEVAGGALHNFKNLLLPGFVNIVYAGRGGLDMHRALTPVFATLKDGLEKESTLFSKLKFYFIGTSYASAGNGEHTIVPLAKKYGVADAVIEITDRIGYFHTLATLQQAAALFIPGSDDPQYTASKIFPYLLAEKPLLAIFNKSSSALSIINQSAKHITALTFEADNGYLSNTIYTLLAQWANGVFEPPVLLKGFENYSAQKLTGEQTAIFIKATANFERTNTNA